MSEVIVRMEKMPQNCYLCPMANFFVDKQPYCRLTMRWDECTKNGFKRPSWCPIIGELPEQHGDLINREYAIASACSGLTRTLRTTEGEEKWIRVKEVRESIKSAPIIVPAERSET